MVPFAQAIFLNNVGDEQLQYKPGLKGKTH